MLYTCSILGCVSGNACTCMVRIAGRLYKDLQLKYFHSSSGQYTSAEYFAMTELNLSPDPAIPYGPEGRQWRDSVSRYAKNPSGKCESYLVKPPCRDPIDVYPHLPDQEPVQREFQSKFQVPSVGLSAAQTEEANTTALERNRKYQKNFIGYQSNPFIEYGHLKDFMYMHTNNVGDPYAESNCQTNTRWIERNVLDYYASLWNIDWPHVGLTESGKETYWGYCLTMGSTEGNMYGLWTARDYVSGKDLAIDVPLDSNPDYITECAMIQAGPVAPTNMNALEPVIFYSEDAHYSLPKTVALEQIKTFYQVGSEKYPDECPLPGYQGNWPCEVPSTDGPFGPGTVDSEKLTALVSFFTGKGHPAIVVFNYGSTFKGAYDDVEKTGEAIMKEVAKQPGGLYNTFEVNYDDGTKETFQRLKVWVHVDGALGASFMNFLEMAHIHGMTDKVGPVFDFRLPFVCSITTSGHKWMGSPWPCGVFMTRSKLVLKPPSIPDYVGSPDTTFAGSRSALSPLILWNYISTHPYDDQVKAVLRCFDYLQYISDELHKLESEHGDLKIEITPLALTIRFKKPNHRIIEKYSLGTETAIGLDSYGNKVKFTYAHLFVMQSTTKEQINEFLEDLRSDKEPFPPQKTTERRLVVRKPLGYKCLMSVPVRGRGYH